MVMAAESKPLAKYLPPKIEEKPITIRVPSDLVELIDKDAKALDESINRIIIAALRCYYAELKKK